MTLTRRTCVVLALLAPALTRAAAPDDDDRLIRQVLQEYIAAVRSANGARAAALLSQESIDFFDELLRLARTATEPQLEAVPFGPRMQAIVYRAILPRSFLLSTDARGLFAVLIDRKLLGYDTVAHVGLGALQIGARKAKGEFLLDGNGIGARLLEFERHGDTWRFNAVPMLVYGFQTLEQMLARRGKDENEFILKLARKLSDDADLEHVWQPLEAPR